MGAVARGRDQPQPPGYYVRRHGGDVHRRDEVAALAYAVDVIEERDCRGLFEVGADGSRWLVAECLDAHPAVAGQVARERRSLLGRVVDELLP